MSGRVPFCVSDSLATRNARKIVTRQIGTLIQNAERQPKLETKNAPSVGPDATPSAPMEPVHAIT